MTLNNDAEKDIWRLAFASEIVRLANGVVYHPIKAMRDERRRRAEHVADEAVRMFRDVDRIDVR